MKDDNDIRRLLAAFGLNIKEMEDKKIGLDIEGFDNLTDREEKIALSGIMRTIEVLLWVLESDNLNPQMRECFDKAVQGMVKLEGKMGLSPKPPRGEIKFSEN